MNDDDAIDVGPAITPCPGLSLRFRGATEPSTVDAAAFTARPRAPAGPDPVAVAGRGSFATQRGPLRVFFQVPRFPIPRVDLVACRGLPSLASWTLRPTEFGHIAEVAPRRGGGRVTSWVFAACLPLAIAAPRQASARQSTPVQRPKSSPPRLPDPEPTPEPAPEPTSEPTSPIPSVDAPMPPPEDVPDIPPDDAPGDVDTSDPFSGPMPPPPPVPSVSDDAIVDAAWEGVDDMRVELRLKGGAKMRGIVGAVQRDTFTLIQDETGAVLVLSKNAVRSLRVRAAPPVPTETGGGAIAAGVVLTSVGAPVFITGVAFVAVCPSCASLHLPMLFIGGGALGGGIPLLVRGARKRNAWRAAIAERNLSAGVSPTRGGWSGGIRFRF